MLLKVVANLLIFVFIGVVPGDMFFPGTFRERQALHPIVKNLCIPDFLASTSQT
jgi:hypothetical protein